MGEAVFLTPMLSWLAQGQLLASVNKDVHNCIIHKYKKWLQERPIKMLMTGF
jgi:hypothetical protein